MAREVSVIIERDADGYYVASMPALRGCHTQATSLDELMARIREAVELCLEVEGKDVEPLAVARIKGATTFSGIPMAEEPLYRSTPARPSGGPDSNSPGC